MGQEYEQPIINYSTYADEDGRGEQFFVLNEDMVGDTLLIFGYINSISWNYVYIIVEDEE